ncbi:MAG: hypothetical protein ACRD3N_07885, partial [Terracidiphilus sp.]
LLGAATAERRLLDWIEALELGNFAECHKIAGILGLGHGQLNRLYLEAVTWEGARPGSFA